MSHPLAIRAGWTDERVEAAKRLRGEGKSASEIARALGSVSRNAVIGKLIRLGFPAAAKPSPPPTVRALPTPARSLRPTPLAAQPKPQPRPAIQRASMPPAPMPPARSSDVVRLREPCAGHCRWPIGDPRDAGFGFCGLRSGEATYCSDHAVRAVDRTQRPISASTVSWVSSLGTTGERRGGDRGPWADAA